MTEETNFDIDNFNLDDITDLPSFLHFPTGAYLVHLVDGFKAKKIAEKPAIEMALTLIEVLQVEPSALEVETDPLTGFGRSSTCSSPVRGSVSIARAEGST